MTAVADLASTEYADLPIASLSPHPANRKHFDPAKMVELEASIRAHGLLTPVLVRPVPNGHQILGGERRYHAAKRVGLETVPCVVREADDREAIALLAVDNLEHEDYHPLDEARAYRELIKLGESADTIAARIQKSKKYVYDRVKLLELIPDLQKLFRDGKIAAGHAILLARETTATQKAVLEQDPDSRWEGNHALFVSDSVDEETGETEPELFADEQIDQGGDILRPVSVRQLRRWLNTHARLDPAREDLPDLFPETAGVLQEAKHAEIPVIYITHEHHVRPEAKIDGQRIYGPRSWKRADDVDDEPPCEYAVAGVLVIGPGRGHGFPVCINKDRCSIHWPDEVAARLKRAERAAASTAGTSKSSTDEYGAPSDSLERWQRQERERRAREKEVQTQFNAAQPEILDTLVAAIEKASVANGAESVLGKVILEAMREWTSNQALLAKRIPPGKTPADLVRHLALQLLGGDVATSARSYYNTKTIDRLQREYKPLGIDVRKIFDAHAPAAATVQTSAQKNGTGKKKRVARKR